MRLLTVLFLSLFPLLLCAQPQKYQGQGAIREVDTSTRPVARQWQGIFSFKNSPVKFRNDFAGARLNGLVQQNDSLFTAFITAENEPVNPSPWYAFKIWAPREQQIYLHLTCQNARHRYHPKLSRDGQQWEPIDSARVRFIDPGTEAFGTGSLPRSVILRLNVGPDTLIVAAQELITSREVYQWVARQAEKPFARAFDIGKSRQGRPIRCLQTGNAESASTMLFISRQHPPEVTGQLAMFAFAERLMANDKLARRFRKAVNILMVPLMNPDGVDNGHWRHNYGGVDLNRDWSQFNHPETRAVYDFMKAQQRQGANFRFGIDFHSTWADIYYTLDTSLVSELPGFTGKWLAGIEKQFPGYQVNAKGSMINSTAVSKNCWFAGFNMEALVYEVGDNTPRDFLREKGEVAAEQMMRLYLEEYAE